MSDTTRSAGVEPRVVVTGLGVINPLGHDPEILWKSVLSGRAAVADIGHFDPTGLPVRLAAEVSGFAVTDRVPRRLAVKSDLFAHYAMAASGEALGHANLSLDLVDRFRVGIFFGNNSCGWNLCERGFREYYGQAPNMINPWQATAWFSAAAQGFVSIRFGVRGYSKSVACDRASGACAMFQGVRAVRWGRDDVVLTGGAEAPITRLGVASHLTTGELSQATDPERAYLPFHPDRGGLVLGEGSTVCVFENRDHALRREAPILGEVLAIEQRTSTPGDPGAAISAWGAALRAAGLAPSDVDVVFAEGCGTPRGDRVEASALRAVFGERGVPVTVPKAGYGHQYGASAATELVCALQAIRDGMIPPTPGPGRPDPSLGVDLVTSVRQQPVRVAAIHATSREGTSVVTLVAAPRE